MSRTALIAKNTFVQIFGRAVGTVLGLLTLGVMTRYLGASGYGAFTTATTFLQFFGILVDFGLSMTVVAMLAEQGVDRDRVAANLWSLRVVSAAGFFALAPLLVLAFPYSADVKSGVAVAAVSFFLIAVNQVLVGVLQKELRMGRAATSEILGRLGLLVGVWLVAHLGLGIAWMMVALIAGNLLTGFWNWLLVRKLVSLDWRFERTVWKQIISRSWPIGMSIAFNLIYLKGDVIVLSLTRAQSEVGVYGAAYKILDVLTVVPIMFMGLVLPLLTHAWSSGAAHDFKRILQKAFDFMAVLALPLVAGVWVVGRDLMRFVAGDEFAVAGDLLGILIIAAGCVFFGSLFGHVIVAIGKQRAMIWGYASDAVLALICYILFVPRWGAPSAAWVTVLSEVYIAFATYWVVRRTTGFAPSFNVAARALAAAVIMGVAVWAVPSSVHVLFRVAFGAVVYGGFVYAFGAVTKERLQELLPKRA